MLAVVLESATVDTPHAERSWETGSLADSCTWDVEICTAAAASSLLTASATLGALPAPNPPCTKVETPELPTVEHGVATTASVAVVEVSTRLRRSWKRDTVYASANWVALGTLSHVAGNG